MAVSVRYPSYPGGVDVNGILSAFDNAFDRGREQKYEREAQKALEQYGNSLYAPQQGMSALQALVPPQTQNTVQRAPLPPPIDPATARVEQAFAAQGQGSAPSIDQMTAYIAKAAHQRGIDPSVAVRVARSEGLAPGVWQSNVMKDGRREPSYGPFQMLVGGGDTGFPSGLGNAFMEQTGLDPSDPQNWQKSVDFALDTAAKSGWGQWYGAKAAGIDNMQGIRGAQTVAPPVQVADAGNGIPATDPASLLPPREAMIGLLKNPTTRPLGIQLAQSAMKLRMGQNDPQAQIEYQIAVEKLRQLQNPQADPGDVLAREKFEWEKSQGGSKNDYAQRASAAASLGLTPDDPAYNSFVLTGKMPREDQSPLTATDKKAILEADEMVSAAEGTIPLLDRALELNDQAYSGPTAGLRGWATGTFGAEGGQATMEFDNLIKQQALNQLKSTFGAAPTEGERKILLEIAGSSDQPAEVRKGILERAKAAVQRRQSLYQQRASDLRGGTFYKPQEGKGNRTSTGVQWSIEP